MAGRSPFDRGEGFESIRDSEAEFAPPKKKRTGGCCCLPVWAVFLIVLFFIAGIAVGLFFLWPRIPTVNYESSSFDSKDSKFKDNNGVLSAHLQAHMNLTNPNYINLDLKNVTIELSVPIEGGNSVSIGSGYLKESQSFAAQSTKKFVIDSDIKLDLNTNDKDNVKAMKNIRDACNAKQQIKLHYFAKSDVPLISWTGYQPSFNGDFKVDCPFDV